MTGAVPSMTGARVLEYLTELGRTWQGHGVAVECGCWLGASMMALARGLVDAGYDRPLWAFDRWLVDASQAEKAAHAGMRLAEGTDSLPMFQRNVESVYPDVEALRGRIQNGPPFGAPIEFFLLDAAKKMPAFEQVMRRFAPRWIPGVTVIGLMDFNFYRKFNGQQRQAYRCQADWVEGQDGRLTWLHEFPQRSPAFFRCEAPIDLEGVRG